MDFCTLEWFILDIDIDFCTLEWFILDITKNIKIIEKDFISILILIVSLTSLEWYLFLPGGWKVPVTILN